MKRKLSWQLFSNSERNEVIETVKQKIDVNGGCIMNFNMFSDLALALSVEIEENRIHSLYRALERVASISEFTDNDLNEDSKEEWLIFIGILFGSGKGALKQEIPEVNG